MRGISSEGNAAKGPAVDRVLVDHGIFENDFRLADQLRDIEPVEIPVRVNWIEIAELAVLVPVVFSRRVALDLGRPVDELVAGVIDVIDDRIDHDLAGKNGANPQIGAAVKDRLAPGDTAPRIDPGEGNRVIGIKLLANG